MVGCVCGGVLELLYFMLTVCGMGLGYLWSFVSRRPKR